jgi:hypothetical protein
VKNTEPRRPKKKISRRIKNSNSPFPSWKIFVKSGQRLSLVVSLILTVYSPLAIYRDTIPKIDSNRYDASSPFALPFSVQNDSILFSSRITRVECIVDKVASNTASITGNGALYVDQNVTIEPGNQVNFRCPIETDGILGKNIIRFPPDKKIKTAHIFMRLQYEILGISLSSSKAEFSWDAKSGIWIKGKIPEWDQDS